MSEILRKFGRYFLFDQIAQGGMAEIYRARLINAQEGGIGFRVIKKIQSAFGHNQEFVQMFKNEMEVISELQHSNIVVNHESGQEGDHPYIAMEWVDGPSLRHVARRLTEKNEPFPISFAVYVAEQTASGLHYAHTFKRKLSDRPLNLIHRDISPQNVLISYDGQVKIIDFGIAKAATDVECTRAGTIKGKPSYLSPEQIELGVTLDGRCDVFALGTVLWELLTGKKLFGGENDLAILKMITNSTEHVKPPSSLNPQVPKKLDQIIMKALKKNRDDRYSVAEDLRRDLHRFLIEYNPDFSSSELSNKLKVLYAQDIVEDRKKIQRMNKEFERLMKQDALKTVTDLRAENQKDMPREAIFDSIALKQFGQKDYLRRNPNPGVNKPRGIDYGLVNPPPMEPKLAQLPPLQPPPVSMSPIQMTDNPTRSKIRVPVAPYEPPRRGSKIPKWILMGGMAAGLFIAVKTGAIKIPPGLFPPPSATPSPTAQPQAKMIDLLLKIVPMLLDAQIEVADQKVDPRNPVVHVPLRQAFKISVQRKGYQTFSREIYLDPPRDLAATSPSKEPKKEIVEINMEPLSYGFLNLRTQVPADVMISGDGLTFSSATPVLSLKLPVGEYDVKLSNEALGMEKLTKIRIYDGTVVNKEETLVLKNN